MHADERGDAPSLEIALTQVVPGKPRREQHHVDIIRRPDGPVVEREAMREHQPLARRQLRTDGLVEHASVDFVGQQHEEERAASRCLSQRARLEAVTLRQRSILVVAIPDEDAHLRVAQRQRLGASLDAVAEDSHGLSLEVAGIGILVVEDPSSPLFAHRRLRDRSGDLSRVSGTDISKSQQPSDSQIEQGGANLGCGLQRTVDRRPAANRVPATANPWPKDQI
jgi:hypothetical protein